MSTTEDHDWYVYVREPWSNLYNCHVISATKGYADRCARSMRSKGRAVRVSCDPAFDVREENIGKG